MNRVLVTSGDGKFCEDTYEVPALEPNQICVRSVMTGVCTSDIAMMVGEFGPLPLHMQGHEGLGRVIGIGADIEGVNFDDYVATRGEPAYADIYNVRENEFVVVPEAHPRYIIEPVACGINVVLGDLAEIQGRSYAADTPKLLIVGTGFLAYVAYKTLKNIGVEMSIDVVGSSNKKMWQDLGVELLAEPNTGYEVVINLKEQHQWFENSIINENGLLIDAVGRTISKRESENLLWKAVTTTRPSPRKSGFLECMEIAVEWIQDGKLNVDSFWTKGYNRDTEWQQAFEDGVNRPAGYSRGYIKWL